MASRPFSTTEFVGREEEMAVLRVHLDQACAGVGGVALLVGEPGIGKTRTAEELAADALLRGARVLWGRCYEGEGAPAFWPWLQVIRSLARSRDAASLQAELGSGATEVAHFVPELRAWLPDLLDSPPLESSQARFRFFDGVTSLVITAARRQPLVIVVDDLHWADQLSLLFLQFLSREIRTFPLLVVGTFRDVGVGRGHPLTETLAVLARERVSERVQLRGLDQSEVARFVELTAGQPAPESLSAAITRETEGNPFFVAEVVRLLQAEGRLERPDMTTTWSLTIPPSVREVIEQRLARLSDRCGALLTVAAVIGREFDLAPLSRVAGLDFEDLLEAIEEAEVARVIAALPNSPRRYAFIHALVRETLYDDLTAVRRSRLHGQVGEALEVLYGSDVDTHLPELAHHFLKAAPFGDARLAIEYLHRAGERALVLLAYEEAANHFEGALRALEMWEPRELRRRCALLLALGDAHRKAGESR